MKKSWQESAHWQPKRIDLLTFWLFQVGPFFAVALYRAFSFVSGSFGQLSRLLRCKSGLCFGKQLGGHAFMGTCQMCTFRKGVEEDVQGHRKVVQASD